jgi:type I restriction enzyme S subunit
MLNQKIIANMIFALPPYEEQQAIAAYLDEKCAKIDAAIANIDKQTDALKRLKWSLINEVISGKRMIE